MTSTLVQTGWHACEEACCVIVIDPSLGERATYSRPMFQVLRLKVNDTGSDYVCDPMRVTAADYEKPGGVLL